MSTTIQSDIWDNQYFSGLFFFTNEKNGEKRLISVIRSCSFSAEENQTGKIGDIKFLLPEGLDRTYYVSEKFLEVNYLYQLLVNLLKTFIRQDEDCSNAPDMIMIRQVGEIRSLLERSLDKISHIHDRMRMMESQAWDKMCAATPDFYQDDYDESGGDDIVTDPQQNIAHVNYGVQK